MDRQDLLDICIIAWIVTVFLIYHYQYLSLARIFIEVYANRYMPGLAPMIAGLIP